LTPVITILYAQARRKWICETVARVQAEKQSESQVTEEEVTAEVEGDVDGEDVSGEDEPLNPPLNVQVMFLEIICDDQNIIRSNVVETKMNSPDYRGISQDKAVEDFLNRIKFYESVYEPLDDMDEGDLSYLKLINVGRRLVCNNM
jgi:hypothetical protein